jgi:hypothetical protein
MRSWRTIRRTIVGTWKLGHLPPSSSHSGYSHQQCGKYSALQLTSPGHLLASRQANQLRPLPWVTNGINFPPWKTCPNCGALATLIEPDVRG